MTSPPPPYFAKRNYNQTSTFTEHARYTVEQHVNKPLRQAGKSRWWKDARRIAVTWRLVHIFSIPNVLIYLWMFLCFWGERLSFRNHIEACEWSNWEQWPAGTNPHHLIFVADPQLVDPHTYPGRPWPLSTATIKYTDLYLQRAFSLMQYELYPDTIIFLGDLFDGGREWSTYHSESPEKEWRKYGEDFWLREYDRFGRLFFTHWIDAGIAARPGQPGRKLVASLPGNHDLGFGTGIQKPVRDRFHAYFGEGNRVDVFGNHTFVSVDTVSLSAMDVPENDPVIWSSTEGFLTQIRDAKRRAAGKELRSQAGHTPTGRFVHKVTDTDITYPILKSDDVTEFPTVLLSHVPLYRAEGTPCGPQREHWPPSKEAWPTATGQKIPDHSPVHDERNAIRVAAGYQYQNVLTPEISQDITKRIGDVSYAFSGDDHDYCEVVHRGYPSGGGGIREITVKSLSWAMGVRRPGFVMASLWNPVDPFGKPLGNQDDATMQTHLCLLPDQLGIFLRYALVALLSIAILATRAVGLAYGYLPLAGLGAGGAGGATKATPILPVSQVSSPAADAGRRHTRADTLGESETYHATMSEKSQNGSLLARNATSRGRSVSPGGAVLGGYGLPASSQPPYQFPDQGNGGETIVPVGGENGPLVDRAGYYPERDEELMKRIHRKKESLRGKLQSGVEGLGLGILPSLTQEELELDRKAAVMARRRMAPVRAMWEGAKSLGKVAGVVLVWYFWLLRNG